MVPCSSGWFWKTGLYGSITSLWNLHGVVLNPLETNFKQPMIHCRNNWWWVWGHHSASPCINCPKHEMKYLIPHCFQLGLKVRWCCLLPPSLDSGWVNCSMVSCCFMTKADRHWISWLWAFICLHMLEVHLWENGHLGLVCHLLFHNFCKFLVFGLQAGCLTSLFRLLCRFLQKLSQMFSNLCLNCLCMPYFSSRLSNRSLAGKDWSVLYLVQTSLIYSDAI